MLSMQIYCLLFCVSKKGVLDLPEMREGSKERARYIADRRQITPLDDSRNYEDDDGKKQQLDGANGSQLSVKHVRQEMRYSMLCFKRVLVQCIQSQFGRWGT